MRCCCMSSKNSPIQGPELLLLEPAPGLRRHPPSCSAAMHARGMSGCHSHVSLQVKARRRGSQVPALPGLAFMLLPGEAQPCAPRTDKGVEGDCGCLASAGPVGPHERDDVPHLLGLVVVPGRASGVGWFTQRVGRMYGLGFNTPPHGSAMATPFRWHACSTSSHTAPSGPAPPGHSLLEVGHNLACPLLQRQGTGHRRPWHLVRLPLLCCLGRPLDLAPDACSMPAGGGVVVRLLVWRQGQGSSPISA